MFLCLNGSSIALGLGFVLSLWIKAPVKCMIKKKKSNCWMWMGHLTWRISLLNTLKKKACLVYFWQHAELKWGKGHQLCCFWCHRTSCDVFPPVCSGCLQILAIFQLPAKCQSTSRALNRQTPIKPGFSFLIGSVTVSWNHIWWNCSDCCMLYTTFTFHSRFLCIHQMSLLLFTSQPQ